MLHNFPDKVSNLTQFAFSASFSANEAALDGQEFIGKAGPAIIMDCIFIILSGFNLMAMVIKGPVIKEPLIKS